MKYLLFIVLVSYGSLTSARNNHIMLLESSAFAIKDSTTIISDSICLGNSYVTPEGISYDTTGIYIDTFSINPTCDSIRILDLKVLTEKAEVLFLSENYCEGDANIPQPGDYPSGNCFADTNRIITITQVIETTTTYLICEGTGMAGITIDTLTDGIGCDSYNIIETIVLTPTPDIVVDSIECGTQSVPGTYISEMTDANGCNYDFIINLSVLPEAFDMSLDTTICKGEEYLGFTETGNYTVPQVTQDGCAFDLFLSLDVVPVVDCNVSVADNKFESIRIWPNPANERIDISTANNNLSVDIFNSRGEIQTSVMDLDAESTLDISEWTNGVYFLRFKIADKVYTIQKMIKI